jgi:hypothetical protein
MFNLSKEHANVIEHIPFKRVHELAFGDQPPVEVKEEPEVKAEDMQVENKQEEEDDNIDIEETKEPQGNIACWERFPFMARSNSADRRTR